MHYLFKHSLFAKLHYLNLEKRDESKRYIYILNHQSFFDVVIMGLLSPQNSYSIGKNSLKFIPYVGLMSYLSGNFFVKRADFDNIEKVLDEVVEKIKLRKCSIIIFPQGTRCEDNKIKNLKRGFVYFAKETKTNILPIVISSYKLTDILFNFRNKKTISIKICDKIDFNIPEKEIISEVRNVMNSTIQELDNLS